MIKYQLKTRQICLFFLAFAPTIKIFTLPSILADTCKEDLWLSLTINTLLELSIIWFLLWLSKKQNLTFIQLVKKYFGKVCCKIIIFLYFTYFLLKAFIPINEQKAFIELALYLNMTTDIYFLPFFAVAFYICLKELRVFGRLADIIWFITLFGYVILIGLSIINTDFSAILPIGANGINKILLGSYKASNWFGDSTYLLFFIGHFKHEKNASIKIILSYIASAVMVILFAIVFYGIFTSIAFRQSFALTEISKFNTVINNVGRFDYIAIFLLLFANVFAMTLPIYFASKCFNYIISTNKKWIGATVVCSLLLICTLVFAQYYASVEVLFSKFISAYFVLIAYVMPFILLPLALKEKKIEKRQV